MKLYWDEGGSKQNFKSLKWCSSEGGHETRCQIES